MLKLQTPVTDLECKVGISYKDRIMMLGSCFSDSIGRQLADFGFDVCVNPFGTLYNPVSILQSIEMLAGSRMFGPEDCVQIGAGDGRWCSFSHHTSFARASEEEFLADANEALAAARERFVSCNKIIITLGTAWCFRNVASGAVVSNCLKRPAAEFVRERLSSAEVTETLRRIAELCPGKQFIFTVSPIRHFKDGAHGNQISKSALLLGIDDFLCGCPVDLSMDPFYPADYFHAYEIMMDELRDYRFYAEDMCHPSQQAVDYIRERFLDWALPSSERQALEENIRRFRHSQHRSSH
ncbi:MAG: GSCFA domain-containing protein [Bacteroidales bacterium]|nr:GSCFA domain-containing protein [Bacteroidales bacterium]MBQ9722768.1 GSCFA domain-containing protein [Bacteroidales bacterium]